MMRMMKRMRMRSRMRMMRMRRIRMLCGWGCGGGAVGPFLIDISIYARLSRRSWLHS